MYLDHFVIFSKDLNEHLHHLKTMFNLFKTHGLVASPTKCQFGVVELEFCGHGVEPNRISPLQDKVSVIKGVAEALQRSTDPPNPWLGKFLPPFNQRLCAHQRTPYRNNITPSGKRRFQSEAIGDAQ